MKNVLVIGLGEIGNSLCSVIEESGKYKLFKKDVEEIEIKEEIDVMHVCIPFFDNFTEVVVNYIEKYNPKLVIINSTVRPGTTKEIYDKCKKNIVHSPVRGKHPNLKEGILDFVKFIGPANEEAGKAAKEHLESLGIKTEITKTAVETELGKLFSTTYYGLCIAYHQEMERICKRFNADFENTVTRFNETYNEINKSANPNVVRPVLFPGFIGGHCVMPNIVLLKKDVKSDFLDFIEKSNEKKKNEDS
jgi:UDP-N-acetyl-D-mannosaminuronate dehydrogenase